MEPFAAVESFAGLLKKLVVDVVLTGVCCVEPEDSWIPMGMPAVSMSMRFMLELSFGLLKFEGG